MTDPIEAVQPDDTEDFQPTWKHFFLVATPGSWKPLSINTDLEEPRSEAEVGMLTEFASVQIGTPAQFIVYFGSLCMTGEPFEDPAAPKQEVSMGRPRLITPPQGLIVPGR